MLDGPEHARGLAVTRWIDVATGDAHAFVSQKEDVRWGALEQSGTGRPGGPDPSVGRRLGIGRAT